MREFILSFLSFFLTISLLSGQKEYVLQVCQREMQTEDRKIKAIYEWIESTHVDTDRLPHEEAVHALLSTEALRLDWASDPCLHRFYHFALSISLQKAGALDEAIRSGVTALRIDSTMENSLSPQILSHLASISYEQKDFETAIYYYRQNYAVVSAQAKAFESLGALNNLGLSYLQAGKIREADSIFQSTYHQYLTGQHPPQSLQASLLDNLSDIRLIRGDTTHAIDLIHQKDSILGIIRFDSIRQFDTWCTLAELYLKKNKVHEANIFLEKAESLFPFLKPLSPWHAYHLELLRFDFEKRMGNKYKALQSANRLARLQVDAFQAIQIRHQTEIDVLHQYADFNATQERMVAQLQIEKEKERQRYQQRITWLSVLCGFSVILGMSVFFRLRQKFNRQRIEGLEVSLNLNEERLRREKLEKELIQKDFEVSEQNLVSVAMDNVRRKSWVSEMMIKIEGVLGLTPDRQGDGVRQVYQDLIHEAQIQDRLNLAHHSEDLIRAAFVHTIKSRYPDLTATELELCILMRLGMTGKEIAVIRNVDAESIRKAKYRLRQKMEFQTPEDMLEYLFSISKTDS